MKKSHGILALCALLTSTAFATPPRLLVVKFQNTIKTFPKGAIGIIPGVQVWYAKKRSDIILYDQSLVLKKNKAMVRRIYVPSTVHWVKPIVAFQEKGGILRYWYCKKYQSLAKLSAHKAAPLLKVTLGKLPANVIPLPNNSGQRLSSCSFQLLQQGERR